MATYKAIQRFRAYVPESLVAESKVTRAIYRKGVCGWQFSMSRQMLLERIGTFDRTLARVEEGAQYIPPRILEVPEYMEWLQDRPRILIRLVHFVAVQSTSELPSVSAATSGEDDLFDLKDSIEQLLSLYKLAVDFELESRSIEPPINYPTFIE